MQNPNHPETAQVRYIDVTESDAVGQRLDNFLMTQLKSAPKSLIYRVLRKGEVRVNGGRCKPTYRIQPGDRIRIPPLRTSAPAVPQVSGEFIRLLTGRVIFENDALLALDKPVGVAVHGGSGVSAGVIEALRIARPGQFLELVHRIDRETSGVLLIAKTRSALKDLHAAFRGRTTRKEYVLFVYGNWPEGEQSVRLPLLRFTTADGERRVRVAAEGQTAHTDFRHLGSGHLIRQGTADGQGPSVLQTPIISRVYARLHTGRTHQIRAHALASGHPLVGDDKYSTVQSRALNAELGMSRLALHAHRLRVHLGGERIQLEAPLPDLFDALLSPASG